MYVLVFLVPDDQVRYTYRTQSTLKPSKSKPHKFYGFDPWLR